MNQLPLQINILHLEDSDLDADLIDLHLKRAGLVFKCDRVWTREDFIDRLSRERFDLILADYKLPSFDGVRALEIAREMARDTPFIFVSATLGEEIAIESLKNGATDYVVKSRLGRLSACIQRALAERNQVSARHRAEQAAETAHKRLAAAMQVAQIGSFEWDVETRQLTLDERSCAILGLPVTTSIPTRTLSNAIIEADRKKVARQFLSAYNLRQRVEGDFCIRLPNGLTRYVAAVCDWFDVDGMVRGIGVFQDISDRKQAEDQQKLVVRELHHRVKNSLATVQAVVTFSLRHASSLKAFEEAIIKRVDALARSHSLLTDDQFGGLLLRDILIGELGAYAGGHAGRIKLEGPPAYLQAQLATTVSLAIHELTTNAAKYGALSNAEGKLHIRWQLEKDGEAPRLTLSWTETDGPEILTPPDHQGFGSILLRRLLGGMSQARVDVQYRREGLHLELSMLLSEQA